MLQRYCQLVEELNAVSGHRMGELSTEEIMHYLDLRFEQEKLLAQLREMLPESIARLQELIGQARDFLCALPPLSGGAKGWFKDVPPGEVVRLVGSLEGRMVQVLEECRLLKEEFQPVGVENVLFGQSGETEEKPPWPKADDDADGGGSVLHSVGPTAEEQVACALEASEKNDAFLAVDELSSQSAHKSTGKGKNGSFIDISPDTVKKIENIIRPRNPVAEIGEISVVKDEEMKSESKYAVIKMAAPVENKQRNGKKERSRR